MRIAVVTTSWPRHAGDPSGHFVDAEVRKLEREGHTVLVMAPPRGGVFEWPGVSANLVERPWRAPLAARWTLQAMARLRSVDVDRVVAHWAVPSAWPIALASRARELHVVSHGADVRLMAALPGAARDELVTRVARRAARWQFVSQSLLEELMTTLPSETRRTVERIAFVEPPLLELPDVTDAVARRKQALAGARVGVVVGRLISSKRVERAIEHAARTREVNLVVVVGDGPERGRLEQLARDRGVTAQFVGMQTREEALAWIGAATMVLHASEKEGLSTVVREAEQLGTPVVLVR